MYLVLSDVCICSLNHEMLQVMSIGLFPLCNKESVCGPVTAVGFSMAVNSTKKLWQLIK